MFKTRGRSGLNAKQITVQTNDPERPRSSLMVKAWLEAELDLDPQHVDFGRVRRGVGATQAVKLVGLDAAEVKVLSVEGEAMRAGPMRTVDAATIVEARLGEGDRSGSIELSLAPDALPGRFMGTFAVVTDHPRMPRLQFRVMGEVQASVMVHPQRIQFRMAGPQEPQKRVVMVDSAFGEAFEVLEVGVDHPALAATFSAAEAGRTRVDVTLNGPIEQPRGSATLRIRTSSEEDPLLEVPIDLFGMTRPPQRPAAAPATSQD